MSIDFQLGNGLDSALFCKTLQLSSDVAALSVVLPPPPQSTVAAAQAAAAGARNVAGPAQAAGNTVLDKAVESLGAIFPEYTR